MKVFTLNLDGRGSKHGTWHQRRERIVETLRSHDPDLVALQAVAHAGEPGELDQAAELARALPGFGHVHFDRARGSRNELGVAWLARKTLHEVSAMRFTQRRALEDEARRIALHARLETSLGPLHAFNLHLSWVPLQTADNLRELVPWLRSFTGQRLLLGDLNTAPDSPLLAALREEGLCDVWESLRPNERGFTFESHAPSMRIDYRCPGTRSFPRQEDTIFSAPDPGVGRARSRRRRTVGADGTRVRRAGRRDRVCTRRRRRIECTCRLARRPSPKRCSTRTAPQWRWRTGSRGHEALGNGNSGDMRGARGQAQRQAREFIRYSSAGP